MVVVVLNRLGSLVFLSFVTLLFGFIPLSSSLAQQTAASPASDLIEMVDFSLTGLGQQNPSGFGRVVARAGDIDKDGIEDFAVFAPSTRTFYFYSLRGDYHTNGLPGHRPIAWVTDSNFGEEPTTVWADLNVDGQAEFYVGNPEYDNGKGVVLVIAIKTFNPTAPTLAPGENRLDFKVPIASGLVPRNPNGPGLNSAPIPWSANNLAYALDGSRTGHSLTYQLDAQGRRRSILSGKPGDVVLSGGQPLTTQSGSIEEFYVQNTALPFTPANFSQNLRVGWRFGPANIRDYAFSITNCRGSVNQSPINPNRRDRVVIGSPIADSGKGAVFVHLKDGALTSGISNYVGNPLRIGINSDPARANEQFGYSVSCLGQRDSTNPSLPEPVVIGAPSGKNFGMVITGRAYLYETSGAAPNAAIKTFDGGLFYDQFGILPSFERNSNIGMVTAQLGDVNGDGTRDYVFSGKAAAVSGHQNGYLYWESLSTSATRTYNPKTFGLVVGENIGDKFAESIAYVDLSPFSINALLVGEPGANKASLKMLRQEGYLPGEDFQLSVVTSPSNPNATIFGVNSAPYAIGHYYVFGATQPANGANPYQLTGLPGFNSTLTSVIDVSTIFVSLSFPLNSVHGEFTVQAPLRNSTPGFLNPTIYLQGLARWQVPGGGESWGVSNLAVVTPGHH